MGSIPAGYYTVDPSHSTLTFELSHLGFSSFVGMFDEFDATLTLDPGDPGQSQVEATIELASLDIPSPPDGFLDDLLGGDWLNAGEQPQMTFRSTRVEPTGEYSARMTGDLSLNGVTAPVTMDVVFNGGWEGIPPDPNARVGFSAVGSLNRSNFDVANGIPEPGSTMGVSDAVQFRIETEFTGPPMQPASDGQPDDGSQP